MQDDESFKSNDSTVLLVPSWWSFDEWQKLHHAHLKAERFRGRHDCKNCQTSCFGSCMTANNCKVAQWSSNRNNGQMPRQMSLLLNNDHSWISHADVTAPSSDGMLISDLVSLDANPSFEKTWSQVACWWSKLRRFVGWSMANHETMGCKWDMIWHDIIKRKQNIRQSSEVYLSCCSTERGLSGDS